MDFEVQRCTRHCSKTSREIAPGEEFYSSLVAEGADVVRYDTCKEAWNGPAEGVLGWWKSQLPEPNSKKVHWAPNDVMLEYFEQLETVPKKQDVRYVLALLMIRRRVVRLEETHRDSPDDEQLVLYCPRRETTYQVKSVTLDDARTGEIQKELADLLFADAR